MLFFIVVVDSEDFVEELMEDLNNIKDFIHKMIRVEMILMQ